jgi:hypothetical protein
MRALTRWVAQVLFCGSLTGCVSAAPSASDRVDTPATTSVDALAAMYQRYVSARTYVDHGVLVDAFRPDDGSESHQSRTTFETAFDRTSGAFRFEYTTTHDQFFDPERRVVWRRGQGRSRSWASREAAIRESDLDEELATLAGVSGTTSRTVPSMLLGWAAGMERDLGYRPDGEGDASGVECVKMTAQNESRTLTLWIGKADRALHRVASRHHHDGTVDEASAARIVAITPKEYREAMLARLRKPRPFVSESTIDYSPVFDAPIDPSRFDFAPPP